MGREELTIQETHFADKLTLKQKTAIVSLSVYTFPVLFYKCIQDRLSKEVRGFGTLLQP